MGTNKNILDKISTYQSTFMTILISLQLFLSISAVVFQLNNFKLNLIVFLVNFMFFFFTKNLVKDKNKSVTLLKASIILFIISILTTPLTFLKASGIEAPVPLYFMVSIVSLFIVYFIFKSESFNEVLNKIIDVDFNLNKSEKANPGDVEICKDLNTRKPVVIPRKDRYLHMLILGPTGSGKTSQIILPMLNQDLENKEMGITVIEPKSDLAEKVYALAKLNGRDCIYFNPISPDCPYFNPLFGDEDTVIENMATTFNMLNSDSQQYFKDMNEQLIRNSLKILKRLYGNKATLIDLSRLIQNSGGAGRQIVLEFTRVPSSSEEIAKENTDLASWFLNDYLMEKSKTYENTSGIRSQITKITSNNYLRRILNPPNGENDVDFDKHLAEGTVMAITTAQGALRDLGKFLGYFIILQFQSAVFRRDGDEDTRKDHSLYIDEFQLYSNPGFSDMLTMGRSFRVASHLATQNRALIGMGSGKDGKNFVELVSTNARNLIVFPGANAIDADYYSKQFGEIEVTKIEKGVSRKKFNPLYGFENIGYPSETVRKTQKKEARMSATAIMERPFGQITYFIIKNNSVQPAGAGEVTFLPREVARSVDEIVKDYKRKRFGGSKERLEDYLKLEKFEEIEISFDDPVEPTIEDYMIENNMRNSESEEEIPDYGTEPVDFILDTSLGNELIDDNIEEDNNEEDDSEKMFEEVRVFNEEIEEDRTNDDDDVGFIPIFGDEEDFLI